MDCRKELEQLDRLRAGGLLSNDEFKAQKCRILDAGAVNWWGRLNRVKVVIVPLVGLLLLIAILT